MRHGTYWHCSASENTIDLESNSWLWLAFIVWGPNASPFSISALHDDVVQCHWSKLQIWKMQMMKFFQRLFFSHYRPIRKEDDRGLKQTNNIYREWKMQGLKRFWVTHLKETKPSYNETDNPSLASPAMYFFFSPRNANEMSSRWNCAQFAIFSCHHRVATSPVSAPWIIFFLGYYPSLVFFISAITFLSVWASCV